MKKLLFGVMITMIAVSPALAWDSDGLGGFGFGGFGVERDCKACPSWRSPASSDMPPVVGPSIFPEDRLRVCHLVKQRIGMHNGHAVYQTHQLCG